MSVILNHIPENWNYKDKKALFQWKKRLHKWKIKNQLEQRKQWN